MRRRLILWLFRGLGLSDQRDLVVATNEIYTDNRLSDREPGSLWIFNN